jgi:hypothetical protein
MSTLSVHFEVWKLLPLGCNFNVGRFHKGGNERAFNVMAKLDRRKLSEGIGPWRR